MAHDPTAIPRVATTSRMYTEQVIDYEMAFGAQLRALMCKMEQSIRSSPVYAFDVLKDGEVRVFLFRYFIRTTASNILVAPCYPKKFHLADDPTHPEFKWVRFDSLSITWDITEGLRWERERKLQ